MGESKETKELRRWHDVMRASLDIPDEVVLEHVRGLLDELHERSMAYAGPAPGGDRGLYKEWALKREAFEFRVAHLFYRTRNSA